jgi:hypothetical protein
VRSVLDALFSAMSLHCRPRFRPHCHSVQGRLCWDAELYN